MIALRHLPLLIATMLLLAIPGVGTAQEEVALGPTGTWQVVVYDPWGEGLVEPREPGVLTVAFLTGGRLEGTTGCGRYFGGYSVDGEAIGLGMISKGFGECGARRSEEAFALSVAFDNVERWRASDDGLGLELLDAAGDVRVALTPDDSGDITGAWIVEAYAKANGTLTPPLPEAPMRLVFEPDGRVEGSTGCRFVDGEYRREGDRVVIGPVEPIGAPCDGPERRPERRLLRVLGETVFWSREGDALTLTDAFDAPLVVARSEVAMAASPSPTADPSLGPAPSPMPSPTEAAD